MHSRCVCRWQKCYKHWQHATKGSVGPFCLNTMGRRVSLFVAQRSTTASDSAHKNLQNECRSVLLALASGRMQLFQDCLYNAKNKLPLVESLLAMQYSPAHTHQQLPLTQLMQLFTSVSHIICTCRPTAEGRGQEQSPVCPCAGHGPFFCWQFSLVNTLLPKAVSCMALIIKHPHCHKSTVAAAAHTAAEAAAAAAAAAAAVAASKLLHISHLHLSAVTTLKAPTNDIGSN